ncbi:hypothetical protein POHY109586_18545 [Polaromonas hydrogenivorans]
MNFTVNGTTDCGRTISTSKCNCPSYFCSIPYCACPNDASAVKAAQSLHKRGRKAHVLNGGIEGWIQAGLPLEILKPESQAHA